MNPLRTRNQNGVEAIRRAAEGVLSSSKLRDAAAAVVAWFAAVTREEEKEEEEAPATKQGDCCCWNVGATWCDKGTPDSPTSALS